MNIFRLLPLITFPLMIKLVAGFYISDVFLLMFFFYNLVIYHKIYIGKLQQYLIFIILLLLIVGTFGLLRDAVTPFSIYSEISVFNSFEYPIKLAIFLLYIWYFKILLKDRDLININIYFFILLIPLLLSLAAFSNSFILDKIMRVYRLDLVFRSWRFGGIFGGDVNSFGLYSSLVLLFLLFFNKKLNYITLIVGILVSLSCILLSGMRTGLLVMVITFVLVYIFRLCYGHIDVVFNKKIFKIFIILFIFLGLIGGAFFSDINVDAITERFSVDALTKDFDSDEKGNLAQATEYFNNVTKNRFTIEDFLFGRSSSITYVDSFYINVLLRYGFIIYILLFLLLFSNGLIFSIYENMKKNKLVLFMVIFTFLVAIKGIFPMANYYVFFLFIMFYFSFKLNERR